MSREMVNSGIPWMGKIPSNWSIGKVKHFYRFITGFTPDSKNESFYDENGTPWVTISDMDGKYVVGTKNGISPNYVSAKNPTLVPSNSLLYSFKLSVGQVARTTFDVYTNEAIASFLPLDNISLDYLFYSSQVCIIENANENIYGAKLLNQDLINNATILFPPLEEQQKIASFLDRKCDEIDEMIALQEKIIEELKAYKQSVITEAVTKGLKPDVPMKDSEVDWIGEIPVHWKTIRIKYLLGERKERSIHGEEEPLSMSQKYGLIPTKEMDVIPNMASSFEGAKIVYPEDLVFNKLKAHLGVFSTSKYSGLVSPDYAVYFGLGRALMPFMEFMFKTPQYISEFRKTATGVGSGLTRLYTSDLFSMLFPLPSIDEQRDIVNYLEEKRRQIDSLINIKLSKIDSLKEYKKSIIYEYVTGKKEVTE